MFNLLLKKSTFCSVFKEHYKVFPPKDFSYYNKLNPICQEKNNKFK